MYKRQEHIQVTEAYTKANHLFYDPSKEAKYTKVVEIDLSTIKPSISGPKRPQDLILLSDAKQEFQDAVVREAGVRGFGLDKKELEKTAKVDFEEMCIRDRNIRWLNKSTTSELCNPFVILHVCFSTRYILNMLSVS